MNWKTSSHVEIRHYLGDGDRKTACSVEWPEDGRDHGATTRLEVVECVACLRAVILDMRAAFKAIRKLSTDEGIAGTDNSESPDSHTEGKAEE